MQPPRAVPEPWQLWLGTTLDLTLVLGASNIAELTAHSLVVYPEGWTLTVDVAVNRFASVDPMDPVDPGGAEVGPGGLRFGIRFADGTRALPGLPGSPLHWRGGTAHDDRYFVNREPDGGDIFLVYEYQSAGIDRGARRIDGAVLRDAAALCTPLWANRR